MPEDGDSTAVEPPAVTGSTPASQPTTDANGLVPSEVEACVQALTGQIQEDTTELQGQPDQDRAYRLRRRRQEFAALRDAVRSGQTIDDDQRAVLAESLKLFAPDGAPELRAKLEA